MNDNLKILVGISIKMLYSEKVLTSIKSMLQKSPSPTETLAKIIATVFRQAVADAQKAGAQLNNQIVMKALTLTVKKTAEILQKEGGVNGEKLQALSKTLLAVTAKFLTELTALPQGAASSQVGMAQQAAPGTVAPPSGVGQGQPMEQAVATPQRPRGLINGAMGGV